MSQDKEYLYKLALCEGDEDVNKGEHENVRLFKSTLKLELGFYKKHLDFFYWLYCRLYGSIEYKVFKQSFIGRMVKFDKKHLQNQIINYTELVLEYEKGQFREKIKNNKKKKNKLIKLSKIKQNKSNKSS